MTKKELMAVAEKYDMVIRRDPITREAGGVYAFTDQRIPELDNRVDELYAAIREGRVPKSAVVVTREFTGLQWCYQVFCPMDWFDLWGWR